MPPAPDSLRAPDHRRPATLESLSARERDVLDGVVRGLTNKQIAIELGISHRTVENHRGRLMRKLRVGSAADLVAIATARPTDTA
ncbi:LuxR C-terminal-related transcriptional regulator [Sphingomonas sp. H39-1-10]|uniref:response regulator transcription factor n=1 Tax=Sphingomonas TaxID=13687 RepID=UPI00088DA8B2|nr:MULTISPECIES: LuxR C-terminal-related transcriptional regulator [Sphingomonas]MDF0487543.1 LuxR C-terminal-related transcriptional regulator [Sphingomonas pollutisoli]SDA16521.1 regulatory protein, luxR family [Sphingomonas sp. NFR15]